MEQKNKILVAPLNWGIGHATRSIPIINALLNEGLEPIIASDGEALELLQKEFPKIKTYKLPAYKIKYAKRGWYLKLKLAMQIPRILTIIKEEQKQIKQIIKKEKLKGIISDNRFGVYSAEIPSVYITHQIKVKSGITTSITTKLHQKIMKKFDEIWIPDYKEKPRLAGELSQKKNQDTKIKYIGVLSRFKTEKIEKKEKENDILVLLSGTEPQRTILEEKLIKELEKYPKKVKFVRGIQSKKQTLKNTKNTTYINFLGQEELQKAIKQSEIVISRSGYSTIMDLAVLQKKAFFIPTPGQTEQEYLAKYLQETKIAPYTKQAKFTIEDLNRIENYTGFNTKITRENKYLFAIFKNR